MCAHAHAGRARAAGGGHKKRMEHAGCTRGLSNAIIPNLFVMCALVAIVAGVQARQSVYSYLSPARPVRVGTQRSADGRVAADRGPRDTPRRGAVVYGTGSRYTPDPGRRTRAPGSHPVTRPCTSPRAEAQASHTPWDPSAGTSLQCALCIVSSGGLPSVRVDTHIVHARPHFHHLISRWSRRRSPR